MNAYDRIKWILFAVLVSFFVACDDDKEEAAVAGDVKVSFGAPEIRVYENVSPLRVSIVLSQPALRDVRVTVAVKSEDGAREGVDYQLLNPEVEISAGSTGGYLEMKIQDYFDVEADRQIVLEIVDVEGAVMSAELLTCELTIVSNEGMPLLGFDEVVTTVAEEAGEVSFAVTLSKPYDMDVTLTVSAEDGTALQGQHYNLLQNELTIPAGDTVGYVGVAIIDDYDVNDDRTFILRIVEAENAQISALTNAMQASIVSDDNQVYVSFDSTAVSRFESDGSVTLGLRLSLAASQEVKVSVAVDESSTGVEGEDYVLTGALEVVFAPGEIEKTISLDLIDDDEINANRTLVFNVESVENALPLDGSSQCVLTITNDDIDFVQLYDDLMGTWTLTTGSERSNLPESVTVTISGGATLEEQNENYLRYLIVSCDAFGESRFPASWRMSYDVETGEMEVIMAEPVIEDVTFSSGTFDIGWYSSTSFGTEPVRMIPSRDYMTLTFSADLYGLSIGGLVWWLTLDDGVMVKN